jgi:septal ring factor EnvC (AmiA/AmiB activator)
MRGQALLKRLNIWDNGSRCRLPSLRQNICASVLFTGVMLLPFISHADDNKQQLKTVQQSIADKEKSVQQQRRQREALLKQLKQQEQSIAQSSGTLRETQASLASLTKDIDKLGLSIKQLEARQATQQKLLAEQLDAAFRQGRDSGLRLLVNSEESQRKARILAYYSYLNQARQKSINDLKQTRTDLASQKNAQQQKQHRQTALLQQQQTQQKRLEEARKARQITLTALDSSIQQDQQNLNQLRQNETRLLDNIAQAEREAKVRAEQEAREAQQIQERQEQAKRQGSTYKTSDNERALISRTGGLGPPSGQYLWPIRGRTLHQFGERLQGELRWKGIVITAGEGTNVKAIADGRVIMADWLQGYGLVVVVEHGKGDMSLYGYNQSALVKVGDQVKEGQPIALVGNSGGQETSSLYFEIRRQGQAVDPVPWLGK